MSLSDVELGGEWNTGGSQAATSFYDSSCIRWGLRGSDFYEGAGGCSGILPDMPHTGCCESLGSRRGRTKTCTKIGAGDILRMVPVFRIRKCRSGIGQFRRGSPSLDLICSATDRPLLSNCNRIAGSVLTHCPHSQGWHVADRTLYVPRNHLLFIRSFRLLEIFSGLLRHGTT
jgi:hypothetical protein